MQSVIGIDLGTTKCCVALWRNGSPEVVGVNDAKSSTTIPCHVAFTNDERFVGYPASRLSKNQQNTVFGVKRLIGREFDDPAVQDEVKRCPFSVIEVAGKPRIQVEYRAERKIFAPEEISAMVLEKMKKTVDAFIVGDVRDAVISVPAFFSDAQRQATIDAGKIAGLNVLRIINEPTATALTYNAQNKQDGKRNILIYDLGGGTFDVSVVTIDDGSITVKATSGDTNLGGKDFDNLLLDYLANEYKRKERKDIEGNAKAVWRLRVEAEHVKRQLSTHFSAAVEVDALVDGVDFSTLVSRACFEELCEPLFNATLEHVQKVLDHAEMTTADVDDVVLVGGSTRIPKVRALLQDFFDGKKLNTSLNPEEAVAYGAAIQAAVTKNLVELNIVEINSQSINVDTKMGFNATIIKKHTSIPFSVTNIFSTSKDSQKEVRLKVYEGDVTNKHTMLAEFVISGFPSGPRRSVKLSVTFHINKNGIVRLTATANRFDERISVKRSTWKLCTKTEVRGMMADAMKYRQYDEQQRLRLEASNKLETVVNTLKDDQKWRNNVAIQKLCDDTLNWLYENKMADVRELQERLAYVMSRVKAV